jgi:ion channel-forming bestrophin family protein
MLLKNNIPIGYVYGKIKKELWIILVYALIVAGLHEYFELESFSIPLAVPAVLGTVISLLLGFRSQQAYDRWWEARHIWGAIVNDSRTLSRQLLTFSDGSEETEDELNLLKKRIINRQIAWCYSLGNFLRHVSSQGIIEKYMSKKDVEYVSHYDHPPLALLELHGKDIKRALDEGYINRYQHVEVDQTLTRLCDAMGKCERIKNTVFPVTYSLYIHFSLMLFISMLPFSLIEYFGYFEIPLVMAISACFLLIEKMAIHLQDPFDNKPTDTPMTTIAKNIEKDLKQMLKDHHPQQEQQSERKQFYVL